MYDGKNENVQRVIPDSVPGIRYLMEWGSTSLPSSYSSSLPIEEVEDTVKKPRITATEFWYDDNTENVINRQYQI